MENSEIDKIKTETIDKNKVPIVTFFEVFNLSFSIKILIIPIYLSKLLPFIVPRPKISSIFITKKIIKNSLILIRLIYLDWKIFIITIALIIDLRE
jgi:hypothetical protein